MTRTIAEHAAHLAFALRTALQYAKGNFSPIDWKSSWLPGDHTPVRWLALQAELRAAYDALIAFGKDEETFANFESIAGFIGQIAHGAYHLGAIRQLSQLTGAELAPEASAGVQNG